MADGPSAEDAATDLGDSDFRLTRERHKRQDASSSMTSFSVGQDIGRRIREDASVFENHPYHRQQHRPPRRNSHLLRRYPGNANVNGVNNNNGGGVIVINNKHHLPNHHHQFVSKNESDCVDTIRVTPFTSPINEDYEEEEEDEEDEDDEDDEDDDDYDDELDEEEDQIGTSRKKSASRDYRGDVRIDVTKTVKNGKGDGDNSNSNGNGSSNNNYNNTNNNNNGKSGGEGGAMTGHATAVVTVTATATRDDNAASCLVGDGRRLWTTVFLDADAPKVDAADVSEMNECRRVEDRNRDEHALEKVNRLGCDKRSEAGGDGAEDATQNTMDCIVSDGSCDRGSSGSGVAAATAAVPASDGGDADAAGATANGLLANRHQGSPFKGQVRMAEDTLVGPCGKKRCADRYDSSESSDSGVAISCGECSSSGTSDITEPGSPCSTSSDEGVAIRGASASPLPSLPKLAPSSQVGTRPQWPWTPPLAATPCSTYKRLKGEPEAGAVPRSGAADPTFRGTIKSKPNAGHHHHESSQGKITEYFKTQIKPQQLKIKKNSEAMSVLVAKSSSEFRRPPTIQRNKAGLAKYLGTVTPNGRMNNSNNDWEVRSTLAVPPPAKRPLPVVIIPRTNGKMDKKLPKPMVSSLPISNDVLKNIPSCKISSLRLSSDSTSNAKNISSSSSTPAPALTNEVAALDFKGCILSKPHVNENNNLTNGCGTILDSLRSQASVDPLARLKVPEADSEKIKERQASPTDDVEEEEEDSRSSASKPPLSPILSAPTTIRFPAREPERQQGTDSGVCRWDKCEDNFESSSELLEHLQAAHINSQTGGDNFVCQWQGCKVQGRTSCSRRWLERHVLSHGGNKPFRCIVDGCGSRFGSQPALERHVNGHFNQSENSNNSGRRSCESGGKLVRRNGKRLRYRRQPWSARIFDYFDSGVMEGLQHRLLQLAKSRTQGRLAETPGNSMALTSQVLARRVELDGKTKVLLRWYPPDIEPDEWVLESEVQRTKNVGIRKAAASHPEEVSLALHSAISGDPPPLTRVKQRRKPVKNS